MQQARFLWTLVFSLPFGTSPPNFRNGCLGEAGYDSLTNVCECTIIIITPPRPDRAWERLIGTCANHVLSIAFSALLSGLVSNFFFRLCGEAGRVQAWRLFLH